MRTCPECASGLPAGWMCRECGWRADASQGVPILATDGGSAPRGFKPEAFTGLFELEAGNFWFRSRNELILWALNLSSPSATSMLEIGCGTGFVLAGIETAHPGMELVGSELFVEGAAVAASRVSTAEIIQMDARRMPFTDEFDVVGAFDVIEHIDDDEMVLRETYRTLRSGGSLLVTVPQHPWMWSEADDYAEHQRRYTRRELIDKVEQAGFEVALCTSFLTLLFPGMAVSRIVGRTKGEFDPLAELKIGRMANWTFAKVCSVERWLIRRGLRFPFGGSLLLVAVKSAVSSPSTA